MVPILKRAEALRRGVDELLYQRELHDIPISFGEFWYTGSYALDTMDWGDLDVHKVPHGDPQAVGPFFVLGRQLAGFEGVTIMTFHNTIAGPREPLPRGLFWGIRLDPGPVEEQWKIDLWATNEDDYRAARQTMDGIQDRMTEEGRRLILKTKQAILTPDGKTPRLSGYHIYQAVLYHGMRTVEDVVDYLRQQGVKDV